MRHISDPLEEYSDSSRQQFFLVSPKKIASIMAAAQILPTDRVVEVGAGAGTVARMIPPCKSLVLIELDERLTHLIANNVPRATQIVQGDGVQLIETISCDVLIGNLPNQVTEQLFPILPQLSFRTAVLAVGEFSDLSSLEKNFAISEVTKITGDDFRPPQQSISRVVKLARKAPATARPPH